MPKAFLLHYSVWPYSYYERKENHMLILLFWFLFKLNKRSRRPRFRVNVTGCRQFHLIWTFMSHNSDVNAGVFSFWESTEKFKFSFGEDRNWVLDYLRFPKVSLISVIRRHYFIWKCNVTEILSVVIRSCDPLSTAFFELFNEQGFWHIFVLLITCFALNTVIPTDSVTLEVLSFLLSFASFDKNPLLLTFKWKIFRKNFPVHGDIYFWSFYKNEFGVFAFRFCFSKNRPFILFSRRGS